MTQIISNLLRVQSQSLTDLTLWHLELNLKRPININLLGKVENERNFRSHYYEKMGFRVVEEKKSLEILLKEKPIDRAKLIQFALRFSVPNIHRILLWKLILEILPLYLDQHGFVRDQRKEQFEDLLHYLHLLQVSSGHLSKPHLFVLMKYLEEGSLKLNYRTQLGSRDSMVLLAINEALSDVLDSDAEVYWVSKQFFNIVKSFRGMVPSLITSTYKLVNKHDEELYGYLENNKFFKELPLQDWFDKGFAGVLPFSSIQRVWDKLLGGSSVVMVYVAICLLLKLKQLILKSNSVHKILEGIKQINETTADLVVSEGIDWWQASGSQLYPGPNTEVHKEHRNPVKYFPKSFSHQTSVRLNPNIH